MAKNTEGSIKERVYKIMEAYNNTYHSGIKCTPTEARKSKNEDILWENSSESLYAKQFKRRYRDTYNENQKVRIAKRENLNSKYDKG